MIKEYYNLNTQESRVQIEDSQIEAVKNKNITKKSVRVFDEEKKTCALAASVGNVPDGELEQKAINLLSLDIPYDYELEQNTKGHFNKEILRIKNSQELEKFTAKMLEDLKNISHKFVVSGAVSSVTTQKTLKNSLNLDLSARKTVLNLDCMLKQKGSGNIFDTGVNFAGFDITDEDYQDFLKNADFIASACLSEIVPLETKKYRVLVKSGLLLRKFYSDVKAIAYEEKSSLLAGKLNTSIFKENININECNDYETFTTYIPFDDEGIIRNKELIIVENGILKNIQYDKLRAKKYGKTTTGNGFREYNTNTYISSGPFRFLGVDQKISDLISNDLVVIPYISSGGDYLPNGNFSGPIQMAFVFKNGKFIGKAPQITLTGNYLECFNTDFISLGCNDLWKTIEDETFVYCDMMVNVN
ncbi:MAG: metallopeptidase TldD-related protein [Candidatus Cloacimonetes bacterium]|nr:metallopeptidase TldD-related protein [Candidatus Cloacimonadota bacterium]